MATLTVLKFDTPEGAGQMLQHIQALQKKKLIKLQDAAIVSWPVGKESPKTKQLAGMAGKGALGGAFWGLLFGLLFFVPIFGMALGAAIGTLGKTIVTLRHRRKFHRSGAQPGDRRHLRPVPDDQRCRPGQGGRSAQGHPL